MTYDQLPQSVSVMALGVGPRRVQEHSTQAGQGCGHFKAPATFPTSFGSATGCPDKIRQVRQRNNRQAVEESWETRGTHRAGLTIGMEQTESNGRCGPRRFTGLPPGGHTLWRAGGWREPARSSLSKGGPPSKKFAVQYAPTHHDAHGRDASECEMIEVQMMTRYC